MFDQDEDFDRFFKRTERIGIVAMILATVTTLAFLAGIIILAIWLVNR